jgi:chromosome segregation ATPase
MSFEKLEMQIGKCERSLSDLKDTDEIVIQSLSEKIELCRSEENRLCKIIEELQIYKEDYIYELSTLREENEDVKESLEMLENHSQKIEKEHIGVRGVKSEMLS